MTTPILITSFENGVTPPSVNGGGLWSTVSGTTAVQGTVKRTGSYALQINVSAATGYIYKTITAAGVVVGSIYTRFGSFPNAWTSIIQCTVTAGVGLGIMYNNSANKLYARWLGTYTGNAAEVTLSIDTWYRIDFKFDVTGNPNTIDFQVTPDGGSTTTATQSTYAQAATTFTSMGMGLFDSCTGNAYFDDIVFSATGGDYPIGAHAVEGLLPDSDGTHNNAANILEDASGADINGTSVFAYAQLNTVPMSDTTTRVQQAGNGTSNYVEVLFGDTSQTNIIGAMAYLAYMSASATANNGGCTIIDEDATVTTLWGNESSKADYSESSMFYKSVILPTPAGGWDQGAVNALKSRLGYSSDANPDPYWENLLLEVAYVTDTGTPATVNAVVGTASAAGIVPSLSAQGNISGTVAIAQAAAFAPGVGIDDGITGVVATASAENIAPVISSTISIAGIVATADAAGVAPSISSGIAITGVVGTASAAMPAPAVSAGVSASVTGVVADATAAGIVPSLSAGVAISGVTGTADAAAIAPNVSVAGDASVSAITATATAAGIVPALSAGGSVAGIVGTASAAGIAPNISASGDVLVSAVTATAGASGIAPTISAGISITGILATAGAGINAPTITGAASVAGIVIDANASAIAPVITSGVSITGTIAISTALMLAPTVTGAMAGDATVTAVLTVALAAMIAPAVANTPYRKPKFSYNPTTVDYHGSSNVITGERKRHRY